ncbi:rho GTPase-activating protein conundrum [Lycorma delicatula]|uniref:rho GTPase-activating protein conundrum n=1 Tax=Lycorma delicatula TaxID=130591 RepID=UPI003F514FD8
MDADLEDYWAEYRIIQEAKLLDDYLQEELNGPSGEEIDGLDEAEWLVSAGLPQLSEKFFAGKEIGEAEVGSAVSIMSGPQAQAVRRRVHSLNHTLRQRGRQMRARHRKPDIREVFRDVESWSTGSRSRSATPDSLDLTPPSPPSPWSQHEFHDSHLPETPPPSFVQIFDGPPSVPVHRNESRREVRRLPSAPLPHHNLFRRTSRSGGDIVASETADGITMVGYQRLGSVRYTVRCGGMRDRGRSGSDPLSLSSSAPSVDNILSDHTNNKAERGCMRETGSQEGLYEGARRHSASGVELGFEEMWRDDSLFCQDSQELSSSCSGENLGCTYVDWLSEEDIVKLRPLLFVELTAMMDSCGVQFHKRKPHKRKRKEESSLFGVSLESLVEKDQQLTNEPHNVPLVFQKVVCELERRGLQEEGVLRVAAHKGKVEVLCQDLEQDFYTRPEHADTLLQRAPVHDLAALLKRLLRDFPEPLLSLELVDLFYQAHRVPDCIRALNLLVLLLPTIHRSTLLSLLSFMKHLIDHQAHNKMSAHNVAMIIAPSLFPPRFVRIDKEDLKAQVGLAATSCRLTETMLRCGHSLWTVPSHLLKQLRQLYEQEKFKHKENNKPMKRLLGRTRHNIREQITRKIDNEVDFQEGIVRVSAPQFQLTDVPFNLKWSTTAGDIVLRLVEKASQMPVVQNVAGHPKLGRRDIKSRALSELAPNGNLSCLLSTADPEMALQTHFLHEVGGNIGQRRIEPSAFMLAVYQENPNAQWVIRCDHRNGSNQTFLRK